MKQYLDEIIKITSSTSKLLVKSWQRNLTITRGTPKQVTSNCDLMADEMIIKGIERKFPNHSYLTEESGLTDKNSDYLWVVDPLDGTGNYLNANPFFAISIALFKKGKPVLGVIEAPILKERYLAIANKGAWLVDLNNNRKSRAHVSKTKKLSQAYILFCEGGCDNRRRMVKVINKIYPQVSDMRKLGAAALELAWVGTGRSEAYITAGLGSWDVAAGMIFVKEAGGRILDYNGQDKPWDEIFTDKLVKIVATNSKINLGKIKY